MSRWDLPRRLVAVSAGACLGALALVAPATEPPSTQRVGSAPTTAGALAGQAPATFPTTAPGDSAGRPFPPEYDVLLARSIFAHGRAGPVAATGPASRPASPEAGLVLRGVASQGPVRTALLEDVNTHSTRQLHVGDDVIGGKVVAINMDGVDRTLGPRVLHVGVGQPIDGSAPPPGIVIAARGAASTTQPAASGDGAPHSGMPVVAPVAVPSAPVQASLKIVETK